MGKTSVEQEPINLQLIALLLHDLETPLTVAKQFLRRLDEGRHDPAQAKHREFQKATLLAVQRAERILEDLLDQARYGEGGILVRRKPTDLRRLVEECITVVRPLLDERDQDLSVQCDIAEPGNHSVDGLLVSRVLDNLLVNALRNAPRASRIEVRTLLKDGRLRAEVLNRAENLLDFDLAGIFEPTRQIELRSERRMQGAGLGLTFSRMAVEAQGGTIGAQRTNQGMVLFWFEIPVD